MIRLARAPMKNLDRRPVGSRQGNYALAALAVLCGAVLFGVYLYKNLSGLTASMTQVLVPGTTEITLPVADDYLIFHEWRSQFGGKLYSTQGGIAGLECSLTSLQTGERVALTAPSGQYSYSIGGRSGASILAFTISRPGRHVLSCGYDAGESGSRAVLAVGQGFFGELMKTIFGALAIAGVTALAAVVMFISAYNRRKKGRRRPGPDAGNRTWQDRPRPIEPE